MVMARSCLVVFYLYVVKNTNTSSHIKLYYIILAGL